MQDQIREKFNEYLDKWRNLEKGQKIKLIAITVILLSALIATIYFVTKPKLEVVYTNLELGQTAQVQEALNGMNIYNKTADGGKTILVKRQDKDAAQIQLAAEGVPTGQQTFADALGQMGMGTTETVRREVMRRQKETDLSRIIGGITGVNSAEVQLFVPYNENAFMASSQKSTAGVKLDLTEPQALSARQVESIALLLTKSVEDLELKDVVIMDSESNTLYASGEDGFGASSQAEVELQKKRTLEDDTRRLLQPMYDEIRVQANILLDWDKIFTTETTYTPHDINANKGLPSRTQTDSSAATNATVGEEPGLPNNGGDVPVYEVGANGPSSAERDIADTTFLYNEIIKTIERQGASSLTDQSSISVMVYNTRLIDENRVREQGLLENTTWDEYKASIKQQLTEIDIPDGSLEAVRGATGIQNVSIYGYEIPEFIDSLPAAPRPLENYLALFILLLLIALLAFALIRRTRPEDITEIEPDLEIEQLLVSSKDEEEQASQEVQQIDYALDSEVKMQIDKFVEDNPEAVAQLLRNWLNDEWE